MSSSRGNGSVSTLPTPRPKSPPKYPDLYGKRRELAKIHMLEREIGFLEEELKSVEGLPPASRSCKEVTDFVTVNADPLVPTTKKIRRSRRIWKWLCGGISCLNISWIFCCHCTPHIEMPRCSDCNMCGCYNPCESCGMPKCECCSCWNWNSQCFNKFKCSWSCCRIPKCPSCFTCSCSCSCYNVKYKCPKCPRINVCFCYL